MEKIIEILNEKIKDNNFVLKKAIYNAKKNTLSVDLYCNINTSETVKGRVLAIIKDELKNAISYVNLDFTYYNHSVAGMLGFLSTYVGENFPYYTEKLNSENTQVIEDDLNIHIIITAFDVFKGYVEKNNLADKLSDLMETIFKKSFIIVFNFVSSNEWESRVESENVQICDVADYENVSGAESYKIMNAKAVIGKVMTENAIFISNIFIENSIAVFAGTISELEILTAKSGKDYARFTVSDITGSVSCMYFFKEANEAKGKDGAVINKAKSALLLVKEGEGVIVKGRINKDTRSGGYICFVNSISLCDLPSEDVMKKLLNKKAYSDYRLIKPTKFVKEEQLNFIENKELKITENALKGSYVVFDLETTGFNPIDDKITEIGAVKVVDGEIIEIFSTFINPERPIPEAVVKITGINDKDVENAPLIDDVMPDFYKFCSGSKLVAHNIEFDYNFIAANGKRKNYYFLQEKIDTLALARNKVKGLSNYKLDTVARHFKLGDFTHHRAYADALICCYIFLQTY